MERRRGEAIGGQAVPGAEDERVDREQVLVDEAERAELAYLEAKAVG